MKLIWLNTSWLFILPMLFAPSVVHRLPSAVIEWQTELEHDFGSIHKERPVEFAFIFKNKSTEPVVLETVRTSCGCTAARWPEEPIAPGATGEIKVEYDAYLGGAFRKKIKVFFAQQKKPEILWISGEVK